MNLIVLKTSFCLILMIAFLIMAFITKDVVNSQLFAILVIIIGALASKHLLPKNPK
ncbi:hypothetical protein [Flavobacterium franklandianum]|uniref:hypothetical protein n=1 Tax=Flavobacterium franklandianum TaxID=2594430 RepID=UPI00163D6E85|nr:hypothetical protein [Flavobacterium franklandianum]